MILKKKKRTSGDIRVQKNKEIIGVNIHSKVPHHNMITSTTVVIFFSQPKNSSPFLSETKQHLEEMPTQRGTFNRTSNRKCLS